MEESKETKISRNSKHGYTPGAPRVSRWNSYYDKIKELCKKKEVERNIF